MKTTTVTCDICGCTKSGTGWSTLWAKAKRKGWTEGEARNVHYCPECSKEKKK